MSEYAVTSTAGAIVFVYTFTGPPSIPGSIDITNAFPMPALGWTTPDGGVTWDAPSITNLNGAQGAGVNTVNTLSGTLAGQLLQAETDTTTMNAWTAGMGVTAPVVAVLQRDQAGWVTLLEGLIALVDALTPQLGLGSPASMSPINLTVGCAAASGAYMTLYVY